MHIVSIGNLDSSTAPLFQQGASVTARLAFFLALGVALVVMDTRYHLTPPLRQALMTALSPLGWFARAPFMAYDTVSNYVMGVTTLERENQALRQQVLTLGVRAQQADALSRDNQQLQALLSLRESQPRRTQLTELLAEHADPFGRKITINAGQREGLDRGSPVVDEAGVLGQVTRVFDMTAEVTLLTDRNATTPVEIQRNGLRTVAQGSAEQYSDLVELRLLATNADVRVGDRVVTSGLDGVYPRGLAVGEVSKVDRQLDAVFARITVTPAAGVTRGRYVLVLSPQDMTLEPARSAASAPLATASGPTAGAPKAAKPGGSARPASPANP